MNTQTTEHKSSQVDSNQVKFICTGQYHTKCLKGLHSLSHLQGAIKNSYPGSGLYKNGYLRRVMVSPSQSTKPCRLKQHLVTICVNQWASGVSLRRFSVVTVQSRNTEQHRFISTKNDWLVWLKETWMNRNCDLILVLDEKSLLRGIILTRLWMSLQTNRILP